MSDTDKLKEIDDAYNEAYSLWGTWLTEAEEDAKVAAGDQWDPNDEKLLIEEGRPALVINQVKKGSDLISGKQRQNPTDIVAFPLEGTTQKKSDIISKVIKWIMSNTYGGFYRSRAFDNTIYTGLGWMAPEMCYDDDPINGEIKIRSQSPFSILIDPYTSSPELEDCDYIIRYKYLTKGKAASLYSKYSDEILKMSGKQPSKFNYSSYRVTGTENKVYVTEKWSKVYEDKIFLYNLITNNILLWDKGFDKLQMAMQMQPEVFQNIMPVRRKIPVVKLIASVNDSLIVYDGDAPDGLSKTMYPFIPIFGFFNPDYPDTEWQYKLFGYPRVLKDSQFELNKTRSIFMDSIFTQVQSGIAYEEGAINEDETNKRGAGQKIVVNAGKWERWKQLNPPTMSAALPQLEEMHKNDMREMGLNPDLLGIAGAGGSSGSAPGISLQLRQNQNLVSLQPMFDNLSIANKMLGKYLVDLIHLWTPQKIMQIIKEELPPDWEDTKATAKYDFTIDEKTGSTTYRESVWYKLQSLVQHGMQPPIPVMMEVADLDQKTKELWMNENSRAEQSQFQVQQLQIQIEQQKLQIELQKQQLANQALLQAKILEIRGDADLETLKQKGDKDIALLESMTDITIAGMKTKATKNA